MKVGILTLPLNPNYGGMLQAFALQSVLEKMGHEIEVFALKRGKPVKIYKYPVLWILRLIKKILRKSTLPIFYEISNKDEIHKNDNAYKFINERINECGIQNLASIPWQRYGAIVVGSDQIWRKEYIDILWESNNCADAFLYQLRNRDIRKISYAPSLGVDKWQYSEDESRKIKESLATFSRVSVREFTSLDLIKDKTGVKAAVVLDPTMLLTSDEWRNLLNINDKNGGVIN